MPNKTFVKSLAVTATLAALAVAAVAAPPASKETAVRGAMERSGGTLEEVLQFETIASLEVGDGAVHFIDETIGKDFGLGILELGPVDLGPLYEMEATALEIFLTLAPEGASVPAALYKAHELARSRNANIPEAPRAFDELNLRARMAEKAVSYQNWTEDTSTCWNWGTDALSLGTREASQIGDPSYDYFLAEHNFRFWSQIPDGTSTTETSDSGSANALPSGVYVNVDSTPWGNERALGLCITHAEVTDGNDWYDCQPLGNEENSVNLWTRVRGENSNGSWYSSSFSLTDYGHGARYRSSSTQDRRYHIEARDNSIKANHCQEQYHSMTRNRNTYSLPDGPGDVTSG